MTATALPRTGALAPALFVLTVFVSAALVFMVEPMIARLILPTLGGSAAVWNTSLAFFQAALLVGYLYAHLLQRLGPMRLQIAVHMVLLAAAAMVLPLHVTGALGDPQPNAPALWLVGVLTLSIGAPFAALSATAPLVQAWHARVFRAEDAREPYGLYAASNLGSLIALLAYPIAVEPNVALRHQTLEWSLGYGVFVLVIGFLGLAIWRRSGRVAAPAIEAPAGAAVTWGERLRWIALAAIPSSLMLGVTTYITTDLGSAPFLWVAPLALYLATFIIAFQTRPLISPYWALMLQGAAVAVCGCFMRFWAAGFVEVLLIHLAAFFFTALICHQALVARRPAPAHLTDFYICLSLGGVIGGGFNAFVAPQIFNIVLEYPLVMVLSCLARPWGSGPIKLWQWLAVAAAALGAVLAVMIVHPIAPLEPTVWKLTGKLEAEKLGAAVLVVTAVAAFILRGRAFLFMGAVLLLIVAASKVGERADIEHSWRSFFGVIRTSSMTVRGLGGQVRMLSHGTTLHGAQAQNPAFRCQPLLYYAHETPIGQVFDAERLRRGALSIGAIGLGAGTVASYVGPTDSMTFFEIDPLVVNVSTNSNTFSYVGECARGPVGVVLGDARLTLAKQPEHKFDILLIDAFSSDSIPAHLLTVEAVRMYLSKLKPDGVVILHLSNRNLNLLEPAQAVVADAGGHALLQDYRADRARPSLWESSEEVVIASPTRQGLDPFRADGRWVPIRADLARPWTDDYTNLFGALVSRWREKLKGRM
jgi:hypothetical protein